MITTNPTVKLVSQSVIGEPNYVCNNLQKYEDHVRGVPRLYVVTSIGNKVEDERETDAMEDVIEKDI